MKRRLLIFVIFFGMAPCGCAIIDKPYLRYFGDDVGLDAEGNLYILTNDYDPNVNGDFLTVKYNKKGKKLWERRFDGPIHGHDTISALTVDGPGNVYVTGYVQLRETEPNDDYHVSATAFGYATIKYDMKGRQTWAGYYDEPKNELIYPEAIEVDRFGNVYVLGSSEVNVPGSGPIDDFDKPVHFVAIKYDSGGKQIWAVRYSEPNTAKNYPSDIAVDGMGNVYVTGTTHTMTFISSDSFTTIKYDKYGQIVWTARHADANDEYGSTRSITVDEKGGTYVLGYYRHSDKKYSDIITIKYDTTGNQEWMSRYREAGNKSVFPSGIGLDDAGNIYITGYVSTPGRHPHAFDDIPVPLMVELVTIKYNAHGKEQWAAKYEGAKRRNGHVNGLGIDRAGNVYVKGYVEHPQTRYKQVGIIIKYNEKGEEEWVTYFEDISESAKIISPSYSPPPEKSGIRWVETERTVTKSTLLSKIKKSSDFNVKDSQGYTLLERAASEGYVDIVKMLIDKGSKVTDSALCVAVRAGQANVVKILAKASGDITADSPCVFEALTWVEEPAVVKALLEAGLDASAQDKDGDSLLELPVSFGHTEIVKLLLDAGADPNARGTFEEPLVHEALRSNDADIVKALIEAGASVNTRNTFGDTLLKKAVDENSTAIVKLLLEAGADVTREEQGGVALLFEAISDDNVETVRLLIEAGIDPFAQNEGGWTALHEAVIHSSKRVLRYLLERGMDANTKNSKGRTPLHDAIQWDRQEIAEILRNYGAKE